MIYGLDYDGTLVQSWTATPLPGVRERLAQLPPGKTFIATNQAGPVFRAVLGEAKYPTVEDVAQRLADGLTALDWRPDLLIVCVHPGRIGIEWSPAAETVQRELQAALSVRDLGAVVINDMHWRKPEPGMLLFTAGYLGDDDLLYIGDMQSDQEAAEKAGARYLDAAAWREKGLP